jgi:predicted transposase YbfD/YdcC
MELTRHFTNITDPRVIGRCLHNLIDILVLILVGTIADCDDFSEIEDYGKDKIDFLRSDLGLIFPNGIPSEDTLDRMMRNLEPTHLESSLRSCATDILSNLATKQLIIDGKEHRGTIPEGSKHATIRTVSIWLSAESLSFGQLQVEDKTNEKTAIPLLIDNLDIKGGIVTIDAIACQQNVVEKIIEKGAEYLIALKKNQGNLYEQVEDWLQANKNQLPVYQCINKEHGRGEERKTYICQDFRFLEECQKWKQLNTLVMVESTRITKKKTTTDHRLYISSLKDNSPKIFHDLVRGHWSIENQLHWQLDLTFREDDSKIRKDNAPLNMNIMRKFALHILSKDKEKISFKRKRKKASRDNSFLIRILNRV